MLSNKGVNTNIYREKYSIIVTLCLGYEYFVNNILVLQNIEKQHQ